MSLKCEVVGLIEIDDDAEMFWLDVSDASFETDSRIQALTLQNRDSTVLTNLDQLASELSMETEMLYRQIERSRFRTNPLPE